VSFTPTSAASAGQFTPLSSGPEPPAPLPLPPPAPPVPVVATVELIADIPVETALEPSPPPDPPADPVVVCDENSDPPHATSSTTQAIPLRNIESPAKESSVST